MGDGVRQAWVKTRRAFSGRERLQTLDALAPALVAQQVYEGLTRRQLDGEALFDEPVKVCLDARTSWDIAGLCAATHREQVRHGGPYRLCRLEPLPASDLGHSPRGGTWYLAHVEPRLFRDRPQPSFFEPPPLERDPWIVRQLFSFIPLPIPREEVRDAWLDKQWNRFERWLDGFEPRD